MKRREGKEGREERDYPTVAMLECLKEELNSLIDKRIGEIMGEKTEEREDKKTKILKEIYDAGGTVKDTEFHKLGRKVGYDPKGLGGLFSWQRKGATLQKVEKIDTTEIVLTPKGKKFLKQKGLA